MNILLKFILKLLLHVSVYDHHQRAYIWVINVTLAVLCAVQSENLHSTQHTHIMDLI